MKTLLPSLILITLLSANSSAGDYFYKGDPITKLEAMRTLIANPNAAVVKCSGVMITDKGTIKNRPKTKSNADTNGKAPKIISAEPLE